MTVDQIRSELDMAEAVYSLAMDKNQCIQASKALESINRLEQMMIAAIQAEDPYTSAADIRYFENLGRH